MNIPANRDQGKSRVAHLRKVIARDASEDGTALRTPPEEELEALTRHMDAKYPGWDAPDPPEAFPETLKACKRLEVRLRAQMAAEGTSKRGRKELKDRLDQLAAHMQATFPA